MDEEPYYPETMDVHMPQGRLTEVLGPDGEPVRYLRRYKAGFDLSRTPSTKKNPETP